MGEYHTRFGADGPETVFKVGTCEDWRYIRRDEAVKLAPRDTGASADFRWALGQDGGNGALFRFPFADEDNDGTAEISARNMFKTRRVWVDLDDVAHTHMTVCINPGMQKHGVPHTNLMVPCPTTLPAPQRDPERKDGYVYTNLPAVSCGPARQVYEIVGERYVCGEPTTVLACAWCDAWFRLSDPGEVRLVREALRDRGDEAIAERVACDPEGEEWIAAQNGDAA